MGDTLPTPQQGVEIAHVFKGDFDRAKMAELLSGGYDLVRNPQVLQALMAESLFFLRSVPPTQLPANVVSFPQAQTPPEATP